MKCVLKHTFGMNIEYLKCFCFCISMTDKSYNGDNCLFLLEIRKKYFLYFPSYLSVYFRQARVQAYVHFTLPSFKTSETFKEK